MRKMLLKLSLAKCPPLNIKIRKILLRKHEKEERGKQNRIILIKKSTKLVNFLLKKEKHATLHTGLTVT